MEHEAQGCGGPASCSWPFEACLRRGLGPAWTCAPGAGLITPLGPHPPRGPRPPLGLVVSSRPALRRTSSLRRSPLAPYPPLVAGRLVTRRRRQGRSGVAGWASREGGLGAEARRGVSPAGDGGGRWRVAAQARARWGSGAGRGAACCGPPRGGPAREAVLSPRSVEGLREGLGERRRARIRAGRA